MYTLYSTTTEAYRFSRTKQFCRSVAVHNTLTADSRGRLSVKKNNILSSTASFVSSSFTPLPAKLSIVRKSHSRHPVHLQLYSCFDVSFSAIRSVSDYGYRSPDVSRESDFYGPSYGQRQSIVWHFTVVVIDGIARKNRVELCELVCVNVGDKGHG